MCFLSPTWKVDRFTFFPIFQTPKMENLLLPWTNASAGAEGNISINGNTTALDDTLGSNVAQKSVEASSGLIYLSKICLPVFLVVGLGGNCLTIIVAGSKIFRSSFHGVLIMAMAVADILYLLCVPFSKSFIQELFSSDVRALSNVGCSIFYALYRASKICSASLIVLVCLERFSLLWFPVKAKLISTSRVAVISVSCVFVGLLAFCGVWSYLADAKEGKCIGVAVTPENKSMAKACSYIGMSLHSFIPTTILLIFTPLTIVKLFHQRSKRLQLSTKEEKGNDEFFRASIMLVSVISAYLILVTPFCVSKHALMIQGTDITTLPELWARNLNKIGEICEETNCVINFFLYVLLNTSFRKHFRSIIFSEGRSVVTGST